MTNSTELDGVRTPSTTLSQEGSFSPPAEADWHRMISEAAYFIAAERGFAPGSALDDWLRAELAVGDMLSR